MWKKRFKNPHNRKIKRSIFHYLLWAWGYYGRTLLPPCPKDFVYPNTKEKPQGNHLVTWINHSTFLVESNGIRFLTDPIFKERCSPTSLFGPKRHHPPNPKLDLLPSIDFILISHNHYDHMDIEAINYLRKRNPELKCIVPIGVKKHWKKNQEVIELKWNQSWQSPQKKVRLHSVPAQHFSGRGFFDKNRSLWMGIVVELGGKWFYFAGDTGYNEIDFKQIGKLYPKIDLSLLPIGAYQPRRFMQAVHVNPEEAVKIHQDVHSRLSVAGHWRTFCLSEEGMMRPPYDLYCALKSKSLSCDQFRVLEPGQTIAW